MIGRLAIVMLLAVGCDSSEPPPPLLANVDVALRGHQELGLEADGSVTPRFLARDKPFAICLAAPPDRDTAQWRLTHAGTTHEPVDRMGATLCYELPWEGAAPGDIEICAELDDAYDGRSETLPCLRAELAEGDVEHERLWQSFIDVMRVRQAQPESTTVEQLVELAARSEQARLPALALRCRLVAAFVLRRTREPDALREGAELLADRPAWLDDPSAHRQAAMFDYERGMALLEGEWKYDAALEALRRSDERFLAIADPLRMQGLGKQAEILARAGAPGDGRARLERAIDVCVAADCAARFVGAARNTLAWLTLQDPDATVDELERIARLLESSVVEMQSADEPIGLANAQINLAYARARLGEDPSAALEGAEQVLAATNAEPNRARWLSAWAQIVRATQAPPEQAAAICRAVAADADAPRLVAWALGCVARAERALERPDRAQAAIDRALFLHEHVADDPAARRTPMAATRPADDLFLAALLAVESDRPAEAWRLIERLDRPPARDCLRAMSPADRESLDATLLELSAVDASDEQRTRRMERARDLLGCARGVADEVPPVDYRAFSVDGQVVLLHRGANGAVRTYRHAQVDPDALRERLLAADRLLRERSGDWESTLTPLAELLVPRLEDLGPRTIVALHGVLQLAPLPALPVVETPARDHLADHTLVVHRPAAALAPGEPRDAAAPPLFVVDPAGNLSGAAAMAADYRRLFPRAQVLHREEATAARVAAALERASWLHVDAHARLEPVFPELSRVRLADGELPAALWLQHAPALELVNLSVCRGGSWPVTADSGRFGMAGLMARAGSEWVVASRADLPNRLSLRFNRSFYRELGEGRTVPEAYREALAELREAHDPTEWGALLLLRGGNRLDRGQTRAARTLDSLPGDATGGGAP